MFWTMYEGVTCIHSELIDADGDGSVLDDVAGMVLGGSKKKKGGLGGMLGGLFGK